MRDEVRYYRAVGGRYVGLPDDPMAPPEEQDADEEPEAGVRGEGTATDRPDYDSTHYLRVLHASYVARLRKAFGPDDFAQLFRPDGQGGLFDRPLSEIEPLWIQAASDAGRGAGRTPN